ncbi:MAG: P-II family nitrogen regulator [Planctomycetota bacterium]|jgi:nitrogen regulatory protein PII
MANKLVVIFVNRAELMEELLEGFLEIGVSGATVVDSVGMGRILSHDVPIFAGIRRLFPGLSPDNKMIFIVSQEELVESILEVVEDVCGPLEQPGAGVAIVIPLDAVRGLRPPLDT